MSVTADSVRLVGRAWIAPPTVATSVTRSAPERTPGGASGALAQPATSAAATRVKRPTGRSMRRARLGGALVIVRLSLKDYGERTMPEASRRRKSRRSPKRKRFVVRRGMVRAGGLTHARSRLRALAGARSRVAAATSDGYGCARFGWTANLSRRRCWRGTAAVGATA